MTARVVPALPPEVLLTAEEFLALPPIPDGRRRELHDGVVVELSPVNPRHGTLQSRLTRRLGNWCEAQGLPEPMVEVAVRLARRRVVAPDVAYVAPGPRRDAALATSALDGPPDLAVEVVSPEDTQPEVRRKVAWYLAADCPLVWVLNPQRRTATVYRPGATARQLGDGDVLDGEGVLPGFRLPLADLWGALGPR